MLFLPFEDYVTAAPNSRPRGQRCTRIAVPRRCVSVRACARAKICHTCVPGSVLRVYLATHPSTHLREPYSSVLTYQVSVMFGQEFRAPRESKQHAAARLVTIFPIGRAASPFRIRERRSRACEYRVARFSRRRAPLARSRSPFFPDPFFLSPFLPPSSCTRFSFATLPGSMSRACRLSRGAFPSRATTENAQ